MKPSSIAFAGVAILTLAACSNQYIERKDSVTLGLGDGVASNIAVMTTDPSPRASQNNSIPMDPVKAGLALARYRAGGIIPGGAPPMGAAPPPPLPGQ